MAVIYSNIGNPILFTCLLLYFNSFLYLNKYAQFSTFPIVTTQSMWINVKKWIHCLMNIILLMTFWNFNSYIEE